MRQQHGGGADRHREGERIAETVGEEQLCHRIADVLFGDAEYRRGVEIVGEFEIGVGVHGAFRLAGRARRIEPEAHIVARRRRGDGIGFGGFEQFVEALVPVRLVAGDDDMDEMFAGFDRFGEFGQQLFGHDQEPRAGILQHEAVVVLGEQRIDRHRDDAGLDGAEERGRPIDGVGEAHQHALFAAHVERAQHMTEALDPRRQRRIAVAAAVIDIGDFLAAPGVEIALEDVGGEIVVARHGVDWRTHRGVSSQGMGKFAHPCPPQSIMPTPKSAGNGKPQTRPLSSRDKIAL